MKFLPILLLAFLASDLTAQLPKDTLSKLYHGLEWRNIGPFRGGRANAIAGVPGDPLTYYMGSTGGGVWKTTDAGTSWQNISDGYFTTTSIGAIAVAPSDANVLYVGTGEHAVRGVMTSSGDGVYRSTDAGKTWRNVGLKNSRQIAEIRIHPRNPAVVYVAVQGDPYRPSSERGVYRSTDGGENWTRVHFVDEQTGAADLSMDPNNPRILYAGMWDHQRQPWQVRSGGPGSGIYKSTDGGDTWERLTKGLPKAMGKVAVDVSPANAERVFANIEAAGETGGVYRSDDGGTTWTQTSKDRVTVARAWYYIEIFADPQDENTVYVLNAPLLRSVDGGKTFQSIANPHGDQHHLWINPDNPRNLALANDGGATISFNGGATWSSQQNQPTGQFYRITADNQFPYRVYGGQQDYGAVVISSRTNERGISQSDWSETAGGESAFLAFDPDDPRRVYGGSYQGNISVHDRETGFTKDIMAYPVVGLGTNPRNMKYRFNWNAPIVTAPQDRSVVYHAGNRVLQSIDGGLSWREISPDLTRNDTAKHIAGGGPYTIEGAGGENYNTITYLVASPHARGTLWVGTDDGLIQLTRDEGENWENVTPKGLKESQINALEVSPHQAGKAYAAVTRYKFGDFRPMVYVTEDYGKSWSQRTSGIPTNHFVRVVREDPTMPGLLYAGTENGLYVSRNDGQDWERFQGNLPNVPVLDLMVHQNDLIAATSGRAFWILDDLGAIRTAKPTLSALTIFAPKPAYRYNVNASGNAPMGEGQNPMGGVVVDYFIPQENDSLEVRLHILNAAGDTIRQFSSQADKSFKSFPGGPPTPKTLPKKPGVNRFAWNLRTETLPAVPGVFTLGDYRGGMVAPGEYRLILERDGQASTTTATVLPHPKASQSTGDYALQRTLLTSIEHQIREIHESVNGMRQVQRQLNLLAEVLDQPDTKVLGDSAQVIAKAIVAWERELIQPDQKTFQDVINFPNRLGAELLNLKSRTDTYDPQPTRGARVRFADLAAEWAIHREALDQLKNRITNFNRMYREREVPGVVLPEGLR